YEVAPRSEALRVGMLLGGPRDTVIVTGKGHEPTQEIAGQFHRYNDREVYLAVHSAGHQGLRTAGDLLATVGDEVVAGPSGAVAVVARGLGGHPAGDATGPDDLGGAGPTEDASEGGLTVLTATGDPGYQDLVEAVRALRRTAVQRRRVAVVGAPAGHADVRELDALGRLAVRLDVQRLAVVGDAARAVHTGAYQEGSWDAESVHLPDVAAAREWLADELAGGDVVLVAGAGPDLAALAEDLRAGVIAP
ncbi:MAG TPA: hypothetical protein PKB06_08470, partial [Actinotalea sp.]|nr:hypothetical protein [Actinotalea sp.]